MLLSSQMNFPKLGPCKKSRWFKDSLNSSIICLKGPLRVFTGGQRQLCSLLVVFFVVLFQVDIIAWVLSPKWFMKIENEPHDQWHCFLFTGISGKGKKDFNVMNCTLLACVTCPLMYDPHVLESGTLWESVGNTRISPETKMHKGTCTQVCSQC